MSDLKREERYIVVKLKDLAGPRIAMLRHNLAAMDIPTRECVVVEPHHPHYEETWENVQRWAEGRASILDERDALAAHVERLEDIIERSTLAGSPAAESALNDTPATSLARLIAEKQAEALERYSRIISEEWIDKGESYGLRTASGQALLQAEELRRQAKEPQS